MCCQHSGMENNTGAYGCCGGTEQHEEENDLLEYIRDMASPANGPDLTDKELFELLAKMSQEEEAYDDLEEDESDKEPQP
jgi:hypothetical protein